MEIIDYDYFLKHKDEKCNCKVKIKCQKCGKESIVSWNALITRQRKYEAICNKCIGKYSPRNALKGTYYDIKFESSYELGFIHHCIKNNIPIKRCDVVITYSRGNEQCRYYPDFTINNTTIIEIKGRIGKDTEIKHHAAQEFCAKNNMQYCFLTIKELRKFDNFIHAVHKEHLTLFDDEHLIVTSQPNSWKETAIPKSDSIGFVYVITNLIKDTKTCKYILTKDFSSNFINSLINQNEKIDIINYANNEYDLLKIQKHFTCIRTDVKFKRVNNVRSKEEREYQSKIKKEAWKNMPEHEKELFRQRMSEAVKGEKNPNYGNKWTDEQKQALSKKRIENGKSLGKLNGMYDKKGKNAINGIKVFLFRDNKKIKTYPSVKCACDELHINQSMMRKYENTDIVYRGMKFFFYKEKRILEVYMVK